MFRDFQLAALVKTGHEWRLLRIPLHQHLQNDLARSWHRQYEAFIHGANEIPFDLGYTPEDDERFQVKSYCLPGWLESGIGGKVRTLDPLTRHDGLVEMIKGIVAFARLGNGDELLLAQSFSRSHVIQPGGFLLLENNVYDSPKRPGLTLSTHLTLVYEVKSRKLVFENFRKANVLVPLVDFVAEASDENIREVLSHPLLRAEDIDAIASSATQWARKRFAMLRASKILDEFSATELVRRSRKYQVQLKVEKGKVVFPAEGRAVKRLLQFLNEEIFRGAITEKLYETNSKRVAND